jgi:tripartite-type tricarboxylate transporter receptor subunit TctC
VQNTEQFIAWARAQRGGVAYASAGIGTVPHLSMALLLNAIGVEGVHVPFRGSAPAVTEVMSGRIPAMFENLPPMAAQLQAGTLRGLAISTAQRHPDWPALPTLAETIPGFEILAWQSLLAPAMTPPATIARIAAEIGTAVRSEAGAATLGRIGALPRPMTPDTFRAFLASEIDKWAAAVRLSGATVE